MDADQALIEARFRELEIYPREMIPGELSRSVL